MGPSGDHETVISLEAVTKRFPGVVALDRVDLDVHRGELHAIVGANGSGKSTIVKVLGGVYTPDGGTITFMGTRLASIGSPAESAHLGIRVIHQEAPLIDTMSVVEAVAVFGGYDTGSLGHIRWKQMRRRVADLLERLDVRVDVNQTCATLAPADRAGVALAIVLGDIAGDGDSDAGASSRVQLLILDEVTAAMPESETEKHFERVHRVVAAGVPVLMVTHRLPEVRGASRLTVLRDGRVVYSGLMDPELTEERIVDIIIGEEVAPKTDAEEHAAADRRLPTSHLWEAVGFGDAPRSSASTKAEAEGASQRPVIEVEDVHAGPVRGVSLTGRAGEIIGFAGLRSSGIQELPLVISSALSRESGRVTVAGARLPAEANPRAAIHAGVGLIPADRLRQGGVPMLSVDENVVLPDAMRYWHRPALRSRVVEAVVDAFDVRPRNPRVLFRTLSGGNQQKVLLGKWLLLRPRVLVLDDPTYGVDPGARRTVFAAMRDAAARGVCVLFFSTEPEQLVATCDRVCVLREGAIVSELSAADLTLENVTRWSIQ